MVITDAERKDVKSTDGQDEQAQKSNPVPRSIWSWATGSSSTTNPTNIIKKDPEPMKASGAREPFQASELTYRLKALQSASTKTSLTSNVSFATNTNSNSGHEPSVERPPLVAASASKQYKKERTSTASLQDESVDDMFLRLSNEFQPIIEPNWDTVIYIGPPPQEHGQDDHEYEYIKQHFSKPYLMNSETLKQAGSSQFNKFLGPMSARAERRLKKLAIHTQIPQDRKPKYYIDLRPMRDEEEALLMIAELTCTHGVLSWHHSHLASGIPKTLIGGKDDLNITSKPHARSWIEVDDAATDNDDDNRETKGTDIVPDIADAILELEPEYSAIRHYMAIERLLHALVGNSPRLNSAAKVWTYFSIAKFFDCATNARVTTWIYDWLLASNNSNFIQANPEIAYRMAMGMQSPDILRTTFAILVGERALLQARRTSSDPAILNRNSYRTSMHGRVMCHLDDDEINRIDHAALSLTNHMTSFFKSMANGPLKLTSPTSELGKLAVLYETAEDKTLVHEAYFLLHEYVRGEIYQALSQNVAEGDVMRLYRTKGAREFNWLQRSQSFADAYNGMPLQQRLLTQSFWSQLENYGLYQESEKVVAWTNHHSLEGLSTLAPDFDGEISCVSLTNLCQAIEDVNLEVANNYEWRAAARDLWDRMCLHPDQISRLSKIPAFTELDHGREVVRALESMGQQSETRIDGFPARPFNENAFTENYPARAVATRHAAKGSRMAIKPAVLLADLTVELRGQIMREILTPGYANEEMGIESEISISQMDILLCLKEEEWKYLPLWAGGLDDGSGGVFAEADIPDMEAVEGFRGGKMGLGNIPGANGEGSVEGSFTMVSDSDSFDQVMTDEGVSTVGKASRIATDGTTSAGGSTVMSLDE